MNTLYLKVDPRQPDPEMIRRAAALIQAQETVAFPTETVYGLGADVYRKEAVEKIFTAKGRPPENPVSVLVSDWQMVLALSGTLDPEIERLARHYWPGPLTLIVPAKESIPSIVTAGQPRVGLRMPDHPAALALIAAAGVPLAAPSANLSGRPSPTDAAHVREDLDGRIAAILDAGETGLGIESTVLDVSVKPFRILRQGAVTKEELAAFMPDAFGKIVMATDQIPSANLTHYRPSAAVIACTGAVDLARQVAEAVNQGKRVGAVAMEKVDLPDTISMNLQIENSGEYARRLYSLLREADEQDIEILYMQIPEESGLGEVIADRIRQIAEN